MAAPVRTLRPGPPGRRDDNIDRRAMVRATNEQRVPRPSLAVVPKRRRTAAIVVIVSAILGVAMIGAVAFQLHLAERQLELDRLDREIRVSMQQYESLRRERAELLAPDRLALIAESYAMRSSTDDEFVMVAPDIDVAVQQSTGSLDQGPQLFGDGLLEEYRTVKGLLNEGP